MKCCIIFFTQFCSIHQVDVGHPSEIDEIFDAISYSKGSSVIRMLHDYLGDKVWICFSFEKKYICELVLSQILIKYNYLDSQDNFAHCFKFFIWSKLTLYYLYFHRTLRKACTCTWPNTSTKIHSQRIYGPPSRKLQVSWLIVGNITL